LLSGSDRDTFDAQVQRLFETWIAVIAEVLMAEGMEEKWRNSKLKKRLFGCRDL
jgi:hypothetical protein